MNTTRSLTKNQAKQAGKVLSNPDAIQEEISKARPIVSEWREAHRVVLDYYHALLKESALREDPDALCVSRLKRYDTIVSKLNRPRLHINLNQMHDIAGCRAIVKDNECVFAIKRDLESALRSEKPSMVKDYIHHPKTDGYRSLHVIAQHDSKRAGLKGLYCELQIRTRLQHEWATALETYDVICGSGLKFDRGSADETRFFALISNVFSLMEGADLVPGVPSTVNDLRKEILELNSKLGFLDRLAACSGSVSVVATDGDFSSEAYCLMCVDYEEQKTDLFIYNDDDELNANELYMRKEELKRGLQDVLLVKVSSLKGLQEAYPSYSMDIMDFLNRVNDFLGR